MGETARFNFNGLHFIVYIDHISFSGKEYQFNMQGGVQVVFALKLWGFDNGDIRALALKIKWEREKILY